MEKRIRTLITCYSKPTYIRMHTRPVRNSKSHQQFCQIVQIPFGISVSPPSLITPSLTHAVPTPP